MDQATFEGFLQDFQQHCRAESGLPDLGAVAGRADAPLVVLLHGIGGNAQHWADPIGLNPAETWLFDLSATPPPGVHGIGSSPPYQPGSVTPWCQLLRDSGISYVNWSQARPADPLEYAVPEAVAVLSALEQRVFVPYEQAVATSGGAVPPLGLLCHSRGGLVARAALRQLGAAGVPHLRQVTTLCTPHHGSYVPALADDYNRALSTALDFSALGGRLPGPLRRLVQGRLDPLLANLANGVREALLHSFGTLAQGPGFDELAPDSAVMRALSEGEEPLPGVRYASFGGSNPTFIHFYLCVAGRAFHLLATASAFLVAQLARLPGVSARYGGLAELDRGDSAVGLASSEWPTAFGATHQVVPVNHMQALIDPALQHAVLDVVRA